MHRILALWAHPRSLSTALERIVIERGDFEVLHEPFSVVYYVHEQRANAVHAKFAADQPSDYESIRDNILQVANERPVCFKDMCYHCHRYLINDESFLQRMTSVFLIRNPKQTIASHYAKNAEVTSEEIGYERQADVFRKVMALNKATPAVIAAEDLQQDPEGVMEALWKAVGFEPRADALSWQAGHRREWDSWKQWHVEVAQSNGVHKRQTDYAETVENNSRLAAFYDHHHQFYDELYEHRIRSNREA